MSRKTGIQASCLSLRRQSRLSTEAAPFLLDKMIFVYAFSHSTSTSF